MRRRFMCKLAGSFSLILFLSSMALGQTVPPRGSFALTKPKIIDWNDVERVYAKNLETDRRDGLSYIISGSIALAGGFVGDGVTKDPVEKGIYALFQTIGIASVGYGAYKWQVGDDRRLLIQSLKNSPFLTDAQKLSFLKTYYAEKKESEQKQRFIKAITHGMIAALNIYNGTQQKQESVKNTLYFIGGANLLACLSFTF